MEIDSRLLIIFGFPVIIFILSLVYAAYQRYLKHQERMAMIAQGMLPADWDAQGEHDQMKSVTSSPIGVTLIGIALTLGLLTLGVGPWLIGGLVPTAVGCAMLVNEFVKESKKNNDD